MALRLVSVSDMAASGIAFVDGSEPGRLAVARELIAEYGASVGVDLSFQAFEHELAELPGAYAPPTGRLLVALVDGEPAGCVALRPLGDEACEMKRLYVRPGFRGLRLGRALAERIVESARELGYRRMLLDTLPSMGAAQGLYRSLGFRETAAYTVNPVPGATFMVLDLPRRR
jgi:putative acetyltransferase